MIDRFEPSNCSGCLSDLCQSSTALHHRNSNYDLLARRDADSDRRAARPRRAAILPGTVAALVMSAMLAGCEAESKSSARAKPKSKASQREAATASPEAAAAPEATKKKKFQPVELGRGASGK